MIRHLQAGTHGTYMAKAKIVTSAEDLLKEGKEKISEVDHKEFSSVFNSFLIDILGLKDDSGSQDEKTTDELMKLIISLRQDARANKDFATSDKIRDELQKINISIKDGKEGTEWSVE